MYKHSGKHQCANAVVTNMLCGYIWVYFLNNVFRGFMQEGFQHIDKTVISTQLQHTLESNTRDVRPHCTSDL